MNVRVEPSIDGSVGGSPPDSDEDQPSVHLPHSHEHVVQRPVRIDTVHPSRPSNVAQASRRASHTRKSTLAPTISSTSGSDIPAGFSAFQSALRGAGRR